MHVQADLPFGTLYCDIPQWTVPVCSCRCCWLDAGDESVVLAAVLPPPPPAAEDEEDTPDAAGNC